MMLEGKAEHKEEGTGQEIEWSANQEKLSTYKSQAIGM
jgi:hypothetical protein